MSMSRRPAAILGSIQEERRLVAGGVEQPETGLLPPPALTFPCPRCTQKLTVEDSQRRYGCPACRGVFDTASARCVAELPPDPNAPIWRSF